MANIIIKKYDHYNRALGTHITSRSHYEKEMKRQGCEPYNGRAAQPKDNKYKPSKWAREVTSAAARQMSNGGQISGSLKHEIVTKLNAKDPKSLDPRIRNNGKGGTFAE